MDRRHHRFRPAALAAVLVIATMAPVLAQFPRVPRLPRVPGVDRAPRPSSPSPQPAAPVSPASVPAADQPVPFAGVEATTIVDPAPRTATLEPGYGRKFAAQNTRPRVTIVNPYMDPAKPLFAERPHIQCRADGGLVVGGQAGFDSGGRALGVGYWSVAPEGAVRPLHVRGVTATAGSGFGRCNAPFAQTNQPAGAFTLARDSRLLVPGRAAVLSIAPTGLVTRIAGPDNECDRGSTGTVGTTDGPPLLARFTEPDRPVEDSSGSLWLADQGGCALRRIAPDGSTTTVLGPDVLCGNGGAREDRPILDNLTWDAAHGELVAGGSRTVAVPVHDLYTMVWRIKPSGETKRVLWAKKASRVSPAGVHLDGVSALAVDAGGQVFIATQQMLFEQRGWDAFQIMRLDEARQTAIAVTGTRIRRGANMAVHPYDGPLDQAHFSAPAAMCAGPAGTLYVADDILIRKVDLGGSVATWVF